MRHILIVAACISISHAGNILGVFPFPSESHHILGSILLGSLAKRGHNVTYISPFKNKDVHPNLTQLVIDEMVTFKDERIQKYLQEDSSFLDNLSRMKLFSEFQDVFLESPKVKWLLESDSKFDVMIHFSALDASVGLAHHFDVPVISFLPVGGFSLADEMFGNPRPSAYVPHIFVPFSDEMNFWQRLGNTLCDLIFSAFSPVIKYYTKKSFGKHFPRAPPYDEMTNMIQMAFVNSHVSTETPRPYVPAMVQIGGFHLQEPEALPADLKTILDEATQGVVYFSFGTNVKVSEISEDKLSIIMRSLGQLPLKVLLKFDKETLRNKPENVEIRKWFPQRGILSHPNVKLFIGHGGYGGCTESLYYGVPMICIPFFGDQQKNCGDVEHGGYGLLLPMNQLTTETFDEALQKVLNDEKLISTAKLKSELYRDQEMNPMDRAAYWVDHVIKHKGAKHLRVKALDLAWYQYYLLDVIAFIWSVMFISVVIFYYILKLCFSRICCRRQVKIKTS